MKSPRRLDAFIALALLLLPLLWFAPQVLGGRTLLPADNLFAFAPWKSAAAAQGVGVPHNLLISDLVLENLPWKSLIVEALRSGDPAGVLWNPRVFTGVPFLAAGQQSTLYPLSALFYILPLWLAYGVFTWLQLGLAAIGMYVFARVLRMSPPAAVLAAVAYAFSGFYVVSVAFTMIIAAAAWLPLILAMIEIVIRKQGEKGAGAYSPIPYIALGALFLGLETLAGHVEITYYTLMVSAFYAAWRLIWLRRSLRQWRPALRIAAWLLIMVALGLALGGAQLIPLYELVTQSFREGSASLQQVRDWAWPSQQILTFLLPDFFGNPTHHSYFDIWQRAWAPVTQNALSQPLDTIDWGVKNYVEGGNYLGIVTLLLAGVALGSQVQGARLKVQGARLKVQGARLKVQGARLKVQSSDSQPSTVNLQPSTVWPFAVLAVLSLLFAFGTPLYAVLYYGLPGYSQLHSAFRWVFPYTLSMAVLAGYGLDMLMTGAKGKVEGSRFKVQGEPSTFNLQPSTFDLQPSTFDLQPSTFDLQPSTLNLQPSTVARILGWFAALVGAGTLAVVLLSVFVPGPFVALGDRLLTWSFWADRAQNAFANGAMLWSYEATGLARFGLLVLLAGAALLWGSCGRGNKEPQQGHPVTVSPRHRVTVSPCHRVTVSPCHLVTLPLLALLILDLWLFGHGFNSAADPKLLAYKPEVIQWLQDQRDPAQPWRLTSFDAPHADPTDPTSPAEKLLNANSAMRYGLEDIRGYDSIIPKTYAAFMQRIQPQGDLLYNRIAPIYTQVDGQPNYAALDNPLLDLLGVKYVVTTHAIPNPGYSLVHEAELKVYENADAFPRAFIVGEAVAAAGHSAALDMLRQVNLRQKVIVEGIASDKLPPAASPELREARISVPGNRELFVDVNISDRGWLVLTDAYFDGWKAYLRRFGVEGEGVTSTGESVEKQLPLYRADGAFRTVYLPEAGQWTVRFVYSPRSFLLGLYTSFLAAVTLLMLAGWWAWGRFYKGERSEVGTVAKNTGVRVAMSLLSKGIDFAFAMLRMRVLSPGGEGSYQFAVAFYGIFEILTFFGLGTLVMRDVARDRASARRYLSNTIAVRSGLWLLSLPVMALVCLFYWAVLGKLDAATARAIGLFALALLFSSISDALSAVFNAFEKMEYPAGIATAVATAKVALGALVLLPPLDWGFVGLASVSLLMNIVQAIWLWAVLQGKVLGADAETRRRGDAETRRGRFNLNLGLDLKLQRYMLRESVPLMINHLLAQVFWRISQWVLYGAKNPAALGIFSAGTKWLDGLNVIPAYFTLAIFPLMSRYAQAGGESLVRAYRLSVQLLYIVALPVAVFFSFGASLLIRVLGGEAYLPGGATALAIMIWSIPIGFINSVTQYVLIAVEQQRFLTKAFLIGVGFTALANLVFVPRFGYLAAAFIQIPAELALFFPFYWAVRRYVAPIPWLKLLGGPTLAAGADAATIILLTRTGAPLILALVLGFAVYVAALALLGVFRSEEFRALRTTLRRRS